MENLEQKADEENERPWYKRRSGKVILAIVVVLIIIAGVCFWIWSKVARNRRFNRQHCRLGKPPFIMPMDQDLQTYFRRSATASPIPLPSGRYEFEDAETIGLDLAKLKTGDLILSRFVRGKDKDAEFDTLCKHWPENGPVKTWSDAGIMRRAKHWTDKEAMHQYYTGKEGPTHVCMIGRVGKPAEGKKLGLSDVQVWNIAWEGRETLSLKDYMNRYPCTMAMYWVVHLNRKTPAPIVDLVEEYVETVSLPQYWYRSLGSSYLCRSRGLSLANRQVFFQLLKQNTGRLEVSQMSERMLALEACQPVLPLVVEDENDKMAPKILTSSGSIDISNPLVEAEMSDKNPTKGWDEWRGLDHIHYSCSGLIYAYLEVFGLTLQMSDAISFKKQKNDAVVAGKVNHVDMATILASSTELHDEESLRVWDGKIHFDATSRMRIMAPQTIAPCDFLRSDFQWANGVYVEFASRFYCIHKD